MSKNFPNRVTGGLSLPLSRGFDKATAAARQQKLWAAA
jgi:hypothetical protein